MRRDLIIARGSATSFGAVTIAQAALDAGARVTSVSHNTIEYVVVITIRVPRIVTWWDGGRRFLRTIDAIDRESERRIKQHREAISGAQVV